MQDAEKLRPGDGVEEADKIKQSIASIVVPARTLAGRKAKGMRTIRTQKHLATGWTRCRRWLQPPCTNTQPHSAYKSIRLQAMVNTMVQGPEPFARHGRVTSSRKGLASGPCPSELKVISKLSKDIQVSQASQAALHRRGLKLCMVLLVLQVSLANDASASMPVCRQEH